MQAQSGLQVSQQRVWAHSASKWECLGVASLYGLACTVVAEQNFAIWSSSRFVRQCHCARCCGVAPSRASLSCLKPVIGRAQSPSPRSCRLPQEFASANEDDVTADIEVEIQLPSREVISSAGHLIPNSAVAAVAAGYVDVGRNGGVSGTTLFPGDGAATTQQMAVGIVPATRSEEASGTLFGAAAATGIHTLARLPGARADDSAHLQACDFPAEPLAWKRFDRRVSTMCELRGRSARTLIVQSIMRFEFSESSTLVQARRTAGRWTAAFSSISTEARRPTAERLPTSSAAKSKAARSARRLSGRGRTRVLPAAGWVTQ